MALDVGEKRKVKDAVSCCSVQIEGIHNAIREKRVARSRSKKGVSTNAF